MSNDTLYKKIVKLIREKNELIVFNIKQNRAKFSVDAFNKSIDLLKKHGYIILEKKLNKDVLILSAKKDESKNSYEDINSSAKIMNIKQKMFVVTGAVAGAPVHKDLLRSIESFCKHNKAELYILPIRSHAQAFESQQPIYDPLLNVYIEKEQFLKSVIFNKNIQAIDIQINPQKRSPF